MHKVSPVKNELFFCFTLGLWVIPCPSTQLKDCSRSLVLQQMLLFLFQAMASASSHAALAWVALQVCACKFPWLWSPASGRAQVVPWAGLAESEQRGREWGKRFLEQLLHSLSHTFHSCLRATSFNESVQAAACAAWWNVWLDPFPNLLPSPAGGTPAQGRVAWQDSGELMGEEVSCV